MINRGRDCSRFANERTKKDVSIKIRYFRRGFVKKFDAILFRDGCAQTTARSRGEIEERSFNGSFKRAAIVRTVHSLG